MSYYFKSIAAIVLLFCVAATPMFAQRTTQSLLTTLQMVALDIQQASASVTPPAAASISSEHSAGVLAIQAFFTAMEAGNASALKQACAPGATFKTHLQDQHGNHVILDETLRNLTAFTALAGGKSYALDIQYDILPPDPGTTEFRAPYQFFLNGKFSHCGVYSFELERQGEVFKVKQMIDTRARQCQD